jgi:hypothetical protein
MDGHTSGMLDAERAKCSFNIETLAEMMGVTKRSKQRQNARALFQSYEAFKTKPHEEYMSYVDQYKSQLQHAADAIQLTRENPSFMMQHMAGKVQVGLFFVSDPQPPPHL